MNNGGIGNSSSFNQTSKSFGTQQAQPAPTSNVANAPRSAAHFNSAAGTPNSSFFNVRRVAAAPTQNTGFGNLKLEQPSYKPSWNDSSAAPAASYQNNTSRLNDSQVSSGQQLGGHRAPTPQGIQQGGHTRATPTVSPQAAQQPFGGCRAAVAVPSSVHRPDAGMRNIGATSFSREPAAQPTVVFNTQPAQEFVEESPFGCRVSADKHPSLTQHSTEDLTLRMEDLRMQTEKLEAATAAARAFLAIMGELGNKLLELQNGLQNHFPGNK